MPKSQPVFPPLERHRRRAALRGARLGKTATLAVSQQVLAIKKPQRRRRRRHRFRTLTTLLENHNIPSLPSDRRKRPACRPTSGSGRLLLALFPVCFCAVFSTCDGSPVPRAASCSVRGPRMSSSGSGSRSQSRSRCASGCEETAGLHTSKHRTNASGERSPPRMAATNAARRQKEKQGQDGPFPKWLARRRQGRQRGKKNHCTRLRQKGERVRKIARKKRI